MVVQKNVYEASGVTRGCIHLSTSLESSRTWYAEQVAHQSRLDDLFEDPFFPADGTTIGTFTTGINENIEWRRPIEITDNPQFIVNGIGRFDARQGEVGDCWLLAAIASLTMHEDLMEQVVPKGQTFEPKCNPPNTLYDYCGMFWFRMWRFGSWIDVIVDDRLPTRNGRLVFVRSVEENEFWSALLEKAYVKLVGTYASMRGGNTMEAMEDFTGGLTEILNLRIREPDDLFEIMVHAHVRSSLMACSTEHIPVTSGDDDFQGLIPLHAYSVTGIRKIFLSSSQRTVHLVRLLNPWGDYKEWSGAWSDRSSEWCEISAEERREMGLVFRYDGEFWMELKDLVKYFPRLELCHRCPRSATFGKESSLLEGATDSYWEVTQELGEWIRNSTAGGCRNNKNSFHVNPQFHLHVTGNAMMTVIIGLMQLGSRENNRLPHTIGYSIYKFPDNLPDKLILEREFFLNNKAIHHSPYLNVREVCDRLTLQPGRYVVIPTTFEPNSEAKFLLRIFSEHICNSRPMDDRMHVTQNPIKSDDILDLDSSTRMQLKLQFQKIANPSGFLSHSELQDILEGLFSKDFSSGLFNSEICRSLLAIVDTDLSGGLCFEEFEKLWTDLRLWKSIFRQFSNEMNDQVKAFELRDAMRAVGFHVTNRIYNALIHRYANENGNISFTNYILLLARLTAMVETYKTRERIPDGRAIFTIEEFARSVMYI